MYLMTKYTQSENPQSLTANQADPKNRAKFTILRKEGIYVGKHTSIFAIAIIDPILYVYYDIQHNFSL
jgi:hypothetical protein